MHQAADIRAQIAADALLQREISHALLAIADTLPAESDLRVVRILTRTLEASWIEHVSFQDGVLFPILVSRHGVRVQDMIDRGRSEHASLSQFHARIGDHLDGLLQAGHEPAEGLETLLRTTHADRLSHFALDAELDGWLPETFNDAECSLCEKWSNARPSLRFPLDLLLKAGRSFPRSGGQLH
jgi:hypothetical protein